MKVRSKTLSHWDKKSFFTFLGVGRPARPLQLTPLIYSLAAAYTHGRIKVRSERVMWLTFWATLYVITNIKCISLYFHGELISIFLSCRTRNHRYNNNNMLAYKAPVCQKTSEAPISERSRVRISPAALSSRDRSRLRNMGVKWGSRRAKTLSENNTQIELSSYQLSHDPSLVPYLAYYAYTSTII